MANEWEQVKKNGSMAIEKWIDDRGVVGIYIHNIKCPRNGISKQGKNPFEQFTIDGKLLSSIITCYNPSYYDAYNDIKNNLERLVYEAISIRYNY